MTYSDFLSAVVFFVQQSLPMDIRAELHAVLKNNGQSLSALTIRRQGEEIAPTIYLREYYEDYCAGADLAEITSRILSAFQEAAPYQEMDLSFFRDYERIQAHLALKLINYEKNRKLLADAPHLRFLDLAAVVYCLLESDTSSTATVLIRNSHLNLWGIERNALLRDAEANTPRLLSSQIRDLSSILEESLGQAALSLSGRLFVLTNRLRLNGASCLLNEEVLRSFAGEQHSGFYVLPSSIHEVILLPSEREDFCAGALQRMVAEINRTEVAETEVLSDHVYYYDRRTFMLQSL